jgi:hypothetical protein
VPSVPEGILPRVNPHSTVNATRSAALKRSDVLLPALGGLAVGLFIFVLAVLGKNHFGPLDGLCNGSLEIEPHQGTGAIANCTLDTTVYSVSVYGYWAGIAVGLLSAAALVLGFVMRPEEFVVSKPKPASAKAPAKPRKSGRTKTAGRSPARPTDGGRQLMQCLACNALNYADSGDVPCYACGGALRHP